MNLQNAPLNLASFSAPDQSLRRRGRAYSVSSGGADRQRKFRCLSEAYLLAVSFFAMFTTCTRRFSAENGSDLFFKSLLP